MKFPPISSIFYSKVRSCGETSLTVPGLESHGPILAGWRAVFLLGALSCAIVAAGVATLCPPIPRAGSSGSESATTRAAPQTWQTVAAVVGRNRTWQLLTMQSLFGGLPFSGFHFLTLLMQYRGYPVHIITLCDQPPPQFDFQ